jgi:hypothetical protein
MKKHVIYTIEGAHLESLEAVARRLYTGDHMTEGDMRNAAHTIMVVIKYAEAIEALRGPGEPYVHLTPKEK